MENQNINQSQNIEIQDQMLTKKEHDFRNIMLTIVGVFVILAAVSGGTYAYYAFSANEATVVNGIAATASINLAVSNQSASLSSDTLGNQPLVPQPATTIAKALVGTNSKNCIDANNNAVCKVFKIKITNPSSAAIYVRVYLKFTKGANSNFTNLKWLLLGQTGDTYTKYTSTSNVIFGLPSSTGSNITTATTATPNSANFTTATSSHGDLVLTSTDIQACTSQTCPYKNYYFVVWINETGTAQNSTDYGTFTGTIYVESADGKGLTSTFTV